MAKTDPKVAAEDVIGELFARTPSKSEQTQIKIIETAIRLFAQKGIEATTYTSLSKACRISRPLINHYFSDLDSLFLAAAKYSRATLLRLAQEGINKGVDYPSMIDGYIEGCFRWVAEYRDQCSFWMLYFYQSSRPGEARDENSALVERGHERIKGLILLGRKSGEFQFSAVEADQLAKTIQLLITGGIVSATTEDGYLTVENAEKIVKRAVHSLLSR